MSEPPAEPVTDRSASLMASGLAIWAVGAACVEALVPVGAVVALAGLWRRQGSAIWREHRAGLGAWVVWCVFCASSTLGVAPRVRAGTPWSALHLALFPLAVVAWRLLDEAGRARVVRALGWALAATCTLAIVQHFVAIPDSRFLHSIEDYLPIYRTREPAPGGGYKAGGFHFHRLRLAHSLVPLALALAWRERERFGRAGASGRALGLALAMLAALRFTYARAAGLAGLLNLGGLAVFARLPRRVRAWTAVAGLTVGSLVPVAGATLERGPPDRLIAWRNGLELARAHPILGVGYGGYAKAALVLNGGYVRDYPHIHNDAHATLLMVAAEGGIVALVLVLLLAVAFARLLGRVSAGQLAIVGAFALLSITHNLAFHPVVFGAFALALAIADDAPTAPEISVISTG